MAYAFPLVENGQPKAVIVTADRPSPAARYAAEEFIHHVEKATGAYNGGVKTPNPAYAAGVKTVAEYARRVLEHATALDDPARNAKSPDTAPASTAPRQKQPGRLDD